LTKNSIPTLFLDLEKKREKIAFNYWALSVDKDGQEKTAW